MPPGDVALADVQDLFARGCAGSLCHIGYNGEPAGQLDLSPGEECANLVGVPAAEDPAQVRVQPGSSVESYLLCKLEPDCDRRGAGTTLMPLGSSTGLPASERDLVAAWIDSGAPGCAGPDAQAPTFAGATTAMAVPSAIRLEWAPASDDTSATAEIDYLVYQATASGAQNFAQPTAVSAPGATTITMGGLPVSTTYYYVVRARDLAGNIDTNTVEVSATTPAVADETPPSFGGLQTASPIGSLSAHLAWQTATDDVSAASGITYHIYIATQSGAQDFATPWTSVTGATEAVVSGLSATTDYYIVVRAADESGNEDQNQVEVQMTTGDSISFAADIAPILNNTCATMACHGGPMPAQELALGTASAYNELVNVESTQCPGRTLVVPSNPGASYLINKITGVDMCLGSRMPKLGTLSAVEIQIITDWITEGAANN